MKRSNGYGHCYICFAKRSYLAVAVFVLNRYIPMISNLPRLLQDYDTLIFAQSAFDSMDRHMLDRPSPVFPVDADDHARNHLRLCPDYAHPHLPQKMPISGSRHAWRHAIISHLSRPGTVNKRGITAATYITDGNSDQESQYVEAPNNTRPPYCFLFHSIKDPIQVKSPPSHCTHPLPQLTSHAPQPCTSPS